MWRRGFLTPEGAQPCLRYRAANSEVCAAGRVALATLQPFKVAHAREHGRQKNQRLDLAHTQRHQARAGAETGQAPADAKQALPTSRRRSTPSALGHFMSSPNKDRLHWRAAAKATAPTPTAAPITSASEGSQAPPRSRKPCTLGGLAMPDTMRPRPRTRPASKAAKIVMA